MISKKQFAGYMSELKELSRIEENINKSLKELDTDFNCICFGAYTSLITKILHDIFDDQDDWIGYFIYERGFGKDGKLGDVKDAKGKPIPFKTYEDLHDMLMDNLKPKEKKK